MKKTIRILSVVLSLVLVMSMLLGMVALAADVPSAEAQAADNNHHAIAGLEGLNNGRDIGGYYTADGQYRVKTGLLFRTAKLADATDADIALLQSLGIKKVIDLRMSHEVLTKPDKKVPGAEYIRISPMFIPNIFAITGDDWNAMLKAIKSGVMDTYMANMYRQLCNDPVAIYGTKQFFKEILSANGDPVLWHCTSGKDRTGIEALLLLAALGVPEDVLVAEHMNTNYFMEGKAQANYDKAYKITHSKWIATEFYKYEGVQPGWIQIALNVIHRSGTIEDYLRDVIGLKDSDFQQLRDTYLEPVAAAALAPAA